MSSELKLTGASGGNIILQGNDTITTDQVFTFPDTGGEIATKAGGGPAAAGYQQGAWTPVAYGGTTTTYTAQIGNWNRIGNTVFACLDITINILGDGSNSAIGGLPYTPNQSGSGSIGYWQNLATPTMMLFARVDANQNYLAISGRDSVGGYALDVTNYLGNATRILASVTYLTGDTTWTPINGATVS